MWRRGEGGWAGWGGPLWSPASCSRGSQSWRNRIPSPPAGDHKGPPIHPSATLAPTDALPLGRYRKRARKPCGFSPGMDGSSFFGAWVGGYTLDHPKPDRYQSLAGLTLRWLCPPERHADATVLLALLSDRHLFVS